jgi:hypothetical protein
MRQGDTRGDRSQSAWLWSKMGMRRGQVLSVGLLAVGIKLGQVERILAQETSPTASPEAPNDLLDNLSSDFLPIFALVLLVALTWSVLLFYDLLKSYRVRQQMWTDLLKRLDERLTAEEAASMGAVLNKAPEGVTGLARTTIALTVATIISVTLILLLIGGAPEDRELVKTIVTALVAALTTIIGFYFGARTSAESTAAASDTLVKATSGMAGSAVKRTDQPAAGTPTGRVLSQGRGSTGDPSEQTTSMPPAEAE